MTNMKVTFRKTIYASTVLLAIILFSLGAGSCYMLSYSLGEDPNRKDVDSAYNVLYKRVPDMRCWVDSLKQGIRLEVDEGGIRASSWEYEETITLSASEGGPIDFTLDRPFLFVLTTSDHGIPLYAGVVTQP